MSVSTRIGRGSGGRPTGKHSLNTTQEAGQ
ncbi:hypothetical protein SALBM217S_08913 [Streptomyces griseoloalbus]